jgi:hypothetical protein
MNPTRSLARLLGAVLVGAGLISGLLLWVVYLLALVEWMGPIGFVVAVIAAPGIVVFPIAYWVIENSFPSAYFVYLAAGVMLPAFGTALMRDSP